MAINRVILIGRMTRDPEKRTLTSGSNVCSFTLAVDNPPRRDGGNSTSFISCQAWTKTADNVCQYCHKGSLVAIDGRLSQRSYEGKDGSKRSIVEVICDKVQFLERKGSQESTSISAVAEPSADEPIESIDSADDDLPF